MPDASPCAHSLHITRANNRSVAHTVLVAQPALEHVCDDLHVPMTMGREAAPWMNVVFIDDAQRAKTHIPRVVILSKRKRVIRLEPAKVEMAALLCFSNCDH